MCFCCQQGATPLCVTEQSSPGVFLLLMKVKGGESEQVPVLNLCPDCRFRMLAEHFLTMYPNLNVDIDGELEQLKVRTAVDAFLWGRQTSEQRPHIVLQSMWFGFSSFHVWINTEKH